MVVVGKKKTQAADCGCEALQDGAATTIFCGADAAAVFVVVVAAVVTFILFELFENFFLLLLNVGLFLSELNLQKLEVGFEDGGQVRERKRRSDRGVVVVGVLDVLILIVVDLVLLLRCNDENQGSDREEEEEHRHSDGKDVEDDFADGFHGGG